MKTLIKSLKREKELKKSIAKLQPKSELSQAKVYNVDEGNITKAKLHQ